MRRRVEPAAAGPEHEGVVQVGRLLRTRRQERGLSLDEVGAAIRVGAHHVSALEEGRFGDLPPQPYARGLVSAYARLLGLEPEELLRVCGAALTGEGGGQPASLFRYPAPERFVWREWALPFALAAVVGATLAARAVLTPPPADLTVPAAAPAAVRVAPPASPPADLPAPIAPQPDEAVALPGVRVTLRCEGTTWAEASQDGAEQRRYELGPGQNLEITARERVVLSLGDAGVIRLSVNQRELGFIGYKGETKFGLSFSAPKTPVAAAARPAAGD